MPDYGLGSWPARRARIEGDSLAFRQGDRSVSYAALADRVGLLARGLAELGVSYGHRVAYLGPNDVATFESFFAATRLGAIFVPLNTRLTAPEVEYLVNDAAPTVVVHSPEYADLLAGTERSSGVRATLSLETEYEALVDAASGLLPVRSQVTLNDHALMLYTSGTTGRPKGALLTHGNLTFNTMNQLAHVDVLSSDTALCMCPLFHATGMGQVSLPTLFKGGTVVVLPKFDAGHVLSTIAELGIASFSAVPTMLQMLCDHPDFADTDLSSVRYAIYGGSMVAERVAVAWQQRGVQLLQGYGMTEASPGVYMAPLHGAAEHPVSIGQPHFFTDVSLSPEPADFEPRPGDSGELLVRGLNVFRGYWNRPSETEQAFTDGWFRSGDVIRVGDDGWAYVIDRVKDMIISGGENIYPAEVEAAITELRGVADAAVVAQPDQKWGEVGHAFVVLDADGDWTEESLRDALRNSLAAFKIPARVDFVPDLPRTATGKVRKQELRARPGSSGSGRPEVTAPTTKEATSS
jgi:fatty-acyl-CoA synthase